ncbi:MAG: FliM/FliN family flagellar motor switch protein [Alphaproteobacteria bacterium]
MNINFANQENEDISIELSVTLGTTILRVQQLLKLGRGAVIELDKKFDDSVDIYANDVLIGKGEVVVTENDTLGVSLINTIKRTND